MKNTNAGSGLPTAKNKPTFKTKWTTSAANRSARTDSRSSIKTARHGYSCPTLSGVASRTTSAAPRLTLPACLRCSSVSAFSSSSRNKPGAPLILHPPIPPAACRLSDRYSSEVSVTPPRHRLLGSRLRRGGRRFRRRPEADQATALLCGEHHLSRGHRSRGGRPRGPLLNTLRPITGHDRAVYTAPVRYSEGASRAMPHPAPSPGMARVASRTLLATRGQPRSGTTPPPSGGGRARVCRLSCLRRGESGILAECARPRPPACWLIFWHPLLLRSTTRRPANCIGLRTDRKVQARVGRLARKCNDGKLTADERAEYEAFVIAGDFVAIMQALARCRLRERAK